MSRILSSLSLLIFSIGLIARSSPAGQGGTPATTFYIKGEAGNDLITVLRQRGIQCDTKQNLADLVRDAAPGSAVLILADEYPGKTTDIPAPFWDEAKQKKFKVYVEYPAALPGVELSAPRQEEWARLVVSSKRLGTDLPEFQILVAQDCHFVTAACDAPVLVLGRVAGYNRAVYGMPKPAAPILFEAPSLNAWVATTKLSQFASGRYAPHREWRALWNWILQQLAPDTAINLDWAPMVRPAGEKNALMSLRQEKDCFTAGVHWYLDSGLLVPHDRYASIVESLKSGSETSVFPGAWRISGDGSEGILEGYSSRIRFDGRQEARIVLRADCNVESAMVLAVDWWTHKSKKSRAVARNLLDFVYFNSGMCGGVRGNPKHPAFGLIGWGAIAPAWTIANYGDDNARTMLATMLAAACLDSAEWDESLSKALHANLRTTGALGFRGDRIDIPDLESKGWKHYNEGEAVNLSPHFEAYPWACYLWAYRQTGYGPFLEKSKTAIRMTMAGFPAKWRWNDNMERAHMLLCLAWLVRLEDTPEHRDWARRVALDLLSVQDASGGLTDRYRPSVSSHYRIPASNEAYGTAETPLIQENGDPVTDQLYVGGFALLGLHETASVLKDERIQRGEDRLANYLCRIQNRSERCPFLNGSWFRAFDYDRWECWASSGDMGWGAWSVETGWAPAWTEAVLGLRFKNISMWDLTAKSTIGRQEEKVMKLMSQNNGDPWPPEDSAKTKR